MYHQYLSEHSGGGVPAANRGGVRASLRRLSAVALPIEVADAAVAAAGDVGRNNQDDGESQDRGTDVERKQGWIQWAIPWVNLFTTFCLMLGYPLAILPVYRAEATSEYVRTVRANCTATRPNSRNSCRSQSWTRFAIVCLIHPVAQEFILTVQRSVLPMAKKHLMHDPKFKHHALQSIAGASLFEEMLVLQRRMMLGGMRDPTATLLSIVVTGLEEAIVRCTMVYRDELWDWFTSQPEPSENEKKWKKLLQAASTANSMRIEVQYIIISR